MANAQDLLNYAAEHGIIDLDTIRKQIEIMENLKYLEMHPYAVWRGTDNKWHTYLPGKESGRIPRKRNTEEEIKQVIIRYWKQEEENPTIAEVFTEWNDRRLELRKISPATHLRNRQCFGRHYKEFGQKRIRQVSRDEMADFLEEQIPEYNLTAKAFSNLKGITKGFLKRAKKRKLIDFSIEEMLYDLDISETNFRKVIKEDYEEVFNEEEMLKMTEYLTEHQDPKNLGILLMFVTGIRVGELVALRNDSLSDGCIRIRRTETKYLDDTGKKYIYDVKEYPKSDAGVREVIIPEAYQWLYDKICTLNPSGTYIFLADAGGRMTTGCIRNRMRRICHRLHIYEKSPHKIRKTYGSILLDNRVDNRLIMEQMGHSDVSCTEKHYHRNRRSINKKTQVISQIPEFRVND